MQTKLEVKNSANTIQPVSGAVHPKTFQSETNIVLEIVVIHIKLITASIDKTCKP